MRAGRLKRNPAGVFTPTTAALAVLAGGVALFLLYVPIVGLAVLSFSARPLTGIPWPLTLEWYASLFEGDNVRWIGPLFTSIGIGLIVSALATIALFYFVFHWNEFFRAMIYLNDQSKWPLQVVLRQFVVEGDKLAMVGVVDSNNYTGASQINIRALKAGMILLTIAPILAIYPLILKFFTKGTMSGALKG